MNGFKYRDIFSKIDTDKNMDQRIKNELLYHEVKTENVQRKMHNNSFDMSHRKSLLHSLSKVAAIRPALPSIIFLTFIVVAFLGIKANLTNGILSPAKDMESTKVLSPDIQNNPDTIKTPDINKTPIATKDETPKEVFNKIPAKEITEIPLIENNEMSEVETTSEPIGETSEVPEVVTTEIIVEKSIVITDNSDIPTTQEGEFYFAWFDVQTNGDIKASIPNLIVRFHGTISSIDANDLTDIVLTRDGNPIENDITLTSKVNAYTWGYEDITDFYFKFKDNNREPGNYSLTGKYKGESFTVYNKIIESAVSDKAANPDDLKYVSWGYYPDEAGNPKQITELVFSFEGAQNTFYQSDLSELKITRNDKEIPFSFGERVFRYLEADGDSGADTSYNLVLDEAFIESGNYIITGKYQGKSFTGQDISIP